MTHYLNRLTHCPEADGYDRRREMRSDSAVSVFTAAFYCAGTAAGGLTTEHRAARRVDAESDPCHWSYVTERRLWRSPCRLRVS